MVVLPLCKIRRLVFDTSEEFDFGLQFRFAVAFEFDIEIDGLAEPERQLPVVTGNRDLVLFLNCWLSSIKKSLGSSSRTRIVVVTTSHS
ncbi:hypothetical protein [Haloarchaeobius iranensis]|uniref:Uncharacterized protein n=1 Tax=Haloarchaeobius iranensis TaxID=996166 RepID=A0A1H0BFA1_9EURY|nr:hypothetical protein [Haloarchaeobius iranensis]SDN44318.1 hypothetical protein SAMN05192554_1396 [Haloarchaeobius iranensis]